jgi:hypothetical protein
LSVGEGAPRVAIVLDVVKRPLDPGRAIGVADGVCDEGEAVSQGFHLGSNFGVGDGLHEPQGAPFATSSLSKALLIESFPKTLAGFVWAVFLPLTHPSDRGGTGGCSLCIWGGVRDDDHHLLSGHAPSIGQPLSQVATRPA